MSVPPAGRETARLLPVGLYGAAASFHRLAAALGARDLRWSLALFVALAGALIAVPVWIATRTLFGQAAAGLAAVVAVAVPAHLVRSYGYWFRYDAPGVLLVTLHVALACVALASLSSRSRQLAAAGSALALVAAVATWRVSLLAIPIDVAFVAWRFATRGCEPGVRAWWTWSLVLATAGFAVTPYLVATRFVVSPLWLVAVLSGTLLWVPAIGSRGTLARSGALAAVAVVAAVAGRSATSGGGVTLPALLAARLGVAHGHDAVAALMLEIQELYPMSPLEFLLARDELVVLGAVLVLAPFAFGRTRGRPTLARAVAAPPAPALVATMCAALMALTLLFARTSALLAPLACVVLGGLFAQGLAPPRPSARVPARAPQPARGGRWLARAAVACGAVTWIAGVAHAAGAFSHLGADESRALRFVAEQTPPNAIVATLWDVGYDLEARGGRASLCDGLIEDDENRRRIVALDAALMRRDGTALIRLCDQYGATWLLVPDATSLESVAAVAGDPVAGKILRGEPLIEGVDTDRVLYHLMMGDALVPGFRRAFVSGGWSVWQRVGATP